MKRRAFIRLMAGTVVLPLAAEAQPSARRIGILALTRADADNLGAVLRQGLREAGFVEGQNIVFESRSAEGSPAALQGLAADLVRLKADVIVAVFTPCVLAAKRATADIPIVAAVMADPIGTGLAASLSRPEGNVTGLSNMGPETAGKCVELFRDMLPSLHRVGALANPADPFTKPFLEQIRLAGQAAKVEIGPIAMAQGANEYEKAFAVLAEGKPDALIVQGINSPGAIADLAVRYLLPSASVVPAYAQLGGLMSYGADIPELFQRSVTFVQKILQGNKPANMPIEQPTKFNLAINLKTAKAVGVAIPPSFLLRADDVIE
jgi:putative ABC transport system substrate-binding protein